jgi:hypothetical protein
VLAMAVRASARACSEVRSSSGASPMRSSARRTISPETRSRRPFRYVPSAASGDPARAGPGRALRPRS